MRLAFKNNKRVDVLTIVVIHYLEAVARRCSTQNVFLKFQKSYCKNPVPVACNFIEKKTLLLVDRHLKNSVSKSIVHVIKHANFQLYRVHPDGVI